MRAYDAYEPCSGCACLVKREEASCPFCGAPRTPGHRRVRRVARMSRARWLAFGSALAGAGCTGLLAPAPAHEEEDASSDGASMADAAVRRDATVAHDAAKDRAAREVDAVAEAGEPDAAVDPGPTWCGSTACDPATHYCLGQCQLFAPELSCGGYDQPDAAWGPHPTCGSFGRCCASWGCQHCQEDDAGGVSISCSCGGCYGSPPTRLDRARIRRAASRTRRRKAR
jgi:hypothetical protein